MKEDYNKLFNKRYKELNKKQKEAVDAIEGPVMVIAGPGTGKTTILTLRIANILKKTDTRPEQILALTFTESGVQSMREKLINVIGPGAYKVNIFTFHSFANYIIKKYPDEFPRIISSDNANEVQKIGIIENIIDENKFEILKPYGDNHYYVSSILSSIRHLKREGITTKDFKDWIEKQKDEKKLEKKNKKNKELLKVYELYEKELSTLNLYDFEDMLLELIKAMENNHDFLLLLQEEYQYILADEHQDANNSQNRILELLASFHKNPNLFIVGDEKQAIFRFQGASLENFLYFKNLYSEVKLINLEENYRSTQSILDASHKLMNQTELAKDLRMRLKSQKKLPEEKVKVVECDSPEAERQYIANEIKSLLKKGISEDQIAVLYRKNKEADPIMDTLSAAGIQFSVFSDRDMLKDLNVRKLLLILETINNPLNEKLLGEISFFSVFNLPVATIYSVFKRGREKRQSIIEEFRKDKELSAFLNEILHLSSIAKNEDLISFFEKLFSETAWGATLVKNQHPLTSLASFDAFLYEIKKYTENNRGHKLEDFLEYIRTMESYRIRISPTERNKNPDSISLMTAHKSKGLEFEYVFITGVTDKTWGNTRDINQFSLPLTSSSTVDDDRRLFYVSLTRAKKKVLVSWSNTSDDGKPHLPTQFILEMKADLVENDRHAHHRQAQALEGGAIFSTVKENILDIEYLRNLFLNETFSVTALNNFLLCPWKYFFRNLVRLPQLQTKHQLYGTAVHSTLNQLFLSLIKKKKVSRNDFLQIFERELERQPLSKNDFDESLTKGKKALGGYFDVNSNLWQINYLNEYNISGILYGIPGTKKEIRLRGIIDKIELTEPIFEEQKVHVVDFKTRKPLSRNEIEGKTKNASGDYKRQLVFYKFLLESDHAKGKAIYDMQTGEIDFIEPDDKGNYKRETFEITNADVSELLKLLDDTLEKIYKLDFFKDGCDEDDCEECQLAKIILS